jgi:3'-5' exonuclease
MKHPKFFIFDIETAAMPWESFDESQQEYLTRGAKTDEERQKKIAELALSPMTSRVVCICLMIMEWQDDLHSAPKLIKQGALVLDESLGDGKEGRLELAGGVTAVVSDERRLITNFWKMLDKYHHESHIITFNGMDFDAPFLVLRSAALGVRPTRNIAVGKPWEIKEKHIDLQKELQLHAFGNNGATRRYNFDFYARAFGIESPKSQGVHGGNVAEFYAEGRRAEIAEYCLRDVRATWELFLKWHQYLYFPS